MKTSKSLWACVLALFALMACAWTAMFFFAGKAQVKSVPLVTEGPDARWNALTPTRSDRARTDRVERLEVKSLHPEEAR